jgi:hypothetical protein
MNNDTLDDMPIRGVAAIARHLKEPDHRIYRGLELGYIAGFKIGGVWHLRPSTQLAHYKKLEEERRAEIEAERRHPAARDQAQRRSRGRPRKVAADQQ